MSQVCWEVRSSCSQMFFKIGVRKNFAILTGKYLCWSLFLIKTPTQLFSYEYCEMFKEQLFWKEYLQWLLLRGERYKFFVGQQRRIQELLLSSSEQFLQKRRIKNAFFLTSTKNLLSWKIKEIRGIFFLIYRPFW